MKTARIIILSLLIAVKAFPQGAGGGFKIHGHISSTTAGTIYIDYTDDTKSIIDSAKITDGNFELSGKIAYPSVAHLTLNNKSVINPLSVFLEATVMTADLKNKPFAIVKFEGSKSNDEVVEWLHKLKDFKNKAANVLDRRDIEQDAYKRKVLDDSVILYNAKKDSLTYDFAANHPHSYLTPRVLYTTYRQYSASQLKKVYEALDPAIAGTTYGKAFLDNIHKMTDNSTGDIAAEISATDYIDNKPFSLKAQKGKYVIVDFWGSWCKPCIQLIPSLVTEYNKYKDKNIEFISVCRDYNGNMSKCKEIATTLGMTWTNLWDSEDKTDKSNITSVYNVGIYPTTILVGPNGEILERGDGDLGFLKCKNRLEKIFKTAL